MVEKMEEKYNYFIKAEKEELFSFFGISEEDEKNFFKKLEESFWYKDKFKKLRELNIDIENLKEIHKRSFQNIRESLKLFLDYCEKEKKLDRDTAQNLLKLEYRKVKETHRIQYNCSEEKILEILSSGKIRPSTEEEYPTGATGIHLLGKRIEIEKLLKIYSKSTPKPVYGYLASEDGDTIWGERNYGNIFFSFKKENIKDRTFFTEGDSLNIAGVIPPLRKKLTPTPKGFISIESGPDVEKRQLNWDHALIAKAIYNLYFSLEGGRVKPKKENEPAYTIEEIMCYIEAQIIGGVNRDDIECIYIPVKKPQETSKFYWYEVDFLRKAENLKREIENKYSIPVKIIEFEKLPFES